MELNRDIQNSTKNEIVFDFAKRDYFCIFNPYLEIYNEY